MLEPILFLYKQRRRPAEALGDFTARVGFDALRAYSQVRLFRQGGVGSGRHRCKRRGHARRIGGLSSCSGSVFGCACPVSA